MKNVSELTDEELKTYYNLYKKAKDESGRAETTKINTFDLKYAYHIVRLLSEIEQILTSEDLDLQEKGRREHMKAIRRGDVSEEDIRKWASEKEHLLETLYHNSNIRQKPDEEAIKQLLINCLEEHYGSIDNCVAQIGWAEKSLKKIDLVLDEIRKNLYK